MNTVRPSAAHLVDVVPYDPKYLPAKAMLSANENPEDLPEDIREIIHERLAKVSLNRYPDPLANELRELIAAEYGLSRNEVLVGNGGDELLFNLSLAWGGPGRRFINLPPTFSVYAQNAKLTGTQIVDVAREEDYSINEKVVLERVVQGDIDCVIITSPNNPTGDTVNIQFLEQLLDVTDALVLVDQAYGEFCDQSVESLIKVHKNLAVLRTFSKAYRLAGVRLGYLLAQEPVIEEFIKVRQPYSVDALSQVIGTCVFENRKRLGEGIRDIVSERERVFTELDAFSGVKVYPSAANYILFKVDNASQVWEELYNKGVLVRDFSQTPGLEKSLRVTIGSAEENTLFLDTLKCILDT